MAHKRKTVTDLDQRVIERKKKYVRYQEGAEWSAVLFLDTPAIPYVYLIMLFMQLLFHHIYANILSVSCISTLNGDAFDYKTSFPASKRGFNSPPLVRNYFQFLFP